MTYNQRGVFVPHRLALGAQPAYIPFSHYPSSSRITHYSDLNRRRLQDFNMRKALKRFRKSRKSQGRGAVRPTIPRFMASVANVHKEFLSLDTGTVSANAQGILTFVYTINVASNQFSAWATIWDEWKLNSLEITITLLQTKPTTLALAYDPDDNQAPITYVAAAQSYRQHILIKCNNTMSKPSIFRVKFVSGAQSIPNSSVVWESTSNTVWPGGIKFAGKSFGANEGVCYLSLRYGILFRTRRSDTQVIELDMSSRLPSPSASPAPSI